MLVKEKAALRALDTVNAERRRLPMSGSTRSTGSADRPDPASLLDLFATLVLTAPATLELIGTLRYLDLTPFGRQEAWEESGCGDGGPGHRWRLHDEY